MTADKADTRPYAVVESGGKQHLVYEEDTLEVERLDAAAGETVELGPVLAVSDGNSLTIGQPAVDRARVVTTVIDNIRGEKVVSFKKKRRKGYSRKKGHRQALTVLKVESIEPAAAGA